ncbi:MAG: PTS system mannose/fructose/sorbose family transporter subunit IID [Coriobacteriaceae bacterium]|nr:PTS system mannose/fructose/sorbose family transporter subunit IID [Coriobacteriaceae bacterium]
MTSSNATKLPNGTTGYKPTQKDLNSVSLRSLLLFQAGWNYERMQNTGYLWVILPTLRKIYGDKSPELQEMARLHCSTFFNTTNFLSNIVHGVDLALEAEDGVDSKDAVAGLKTGLMGPLASIGDSIFGALLPTVFGALAANMAMQGQPWGILIWVVVNLFIDWFRCAQTRVAYDQGIKLVTTMSDKLNAITDAACVMGVFMVGALVATNVGLSFDIRPEIVTEAGSIVIDIPNICNMIMPKLVPAVLVGFVYWLLGKKGMTSTKAIIIVLIITVALGACGVLIKG